MLMFLHNDKYVQRISGDTINVSIDEFRELQHILSPTDIRIRPSCPHEDLRQCLAVCRLLGLELELMRQKTWKVAIVEPITDATATL